MEIPSKCDGWFPPEVCSWTSYNATLLGVPETYISIPFLVATAYCAQHTVVTIDFHTKPTKSASLQLVMELINNIPNVNPNAGHLFDSVIREHREGVKKQGIYRSLYSGSTSSKKTKTSGCLEMHDLRFNMIAFT